MIPIRLVFRSDTRRAEEAKAIEFFELHKENILALVKKFATEDENFCLIIAARLIQTGTSTVHALTEALKNENRRVRFYATFILGKIGRDATVAVPSLTESFADEKNPHFQTAFALKQIGTPKALKAVEEFEKNGR